MNLAKPIGLAKRLTSFFLKVYGIEQVFAEVESARSKCAIIMVVCNEINVGEPVPSPLKHRIPNTQELRQF